VGKTLLIPPPLLSHLPHRALFPNFFRTQHHGTGCPPLSHTTCVGASAPPVHSARASVPPVQYMVRGGRSGSSYGRSSRGRGLLVATGSGEFTPPHPRVPVVGPSSMSLTVAVAAGPASVSPPVAAGLVPKDVDSLQEGGGSFYDSTLRKLWINGDKIEPAQASQFITRTIQAHFPGPIHRFNDFPMEEKCTESFSECRPDSLEGAGTDMDEERLVGKFVQHMGCREMATNIHNNESESGCQSRGQHAYKWICLLCDPSVQIGVI
ncbi:hypothetical protein Taro_021928, partial [Colocasia esculenta]|nr:hypothetical protein [Colocasia esculenta]